MSEKFNWDETLREVIEESDRKDRLKTKIAKWIAVAIISSAAVANALYLWNELFSK